LYCQKKRAAAKVEERNYEMKPMEIGTPEPSKKMYTGQTPTILGYNTGRKLELMGARGAYPKSPPPSYDTPSYGNQKKDNLGFTNYFDSTSTPSTADTSGQPNRTVYKYDPNNITAGWEHLLFHIDKT